jgi:hypothetical protein
VSNERHSIGQKAKGYGCTCCGFFGTSNSKQDCPPNGVVSQMSVGQMFFRPKVAEPKKVADQ